MANPTAPLCNIEISSPPADPVPATSMRTIPNNASLQQAIQTINQNFRVLFNGFNGVNGFNGQRGPQGQQGQPGTPAKHGNWTLQPAPEPTQKVRVYQVLPDGTKNTDNYVDVVRPTSVTMVNNVTGDRFTIPGPPDPGGG